MSVVSTAPALTVSKGARDLAAALVLDPMAVYQTADESGDFAGEAKRGAAAYANMTKAEEAIGATKTYVGAYVVRMLDRASKDGKVEYADLKTILPVSAGRVSQLRNAGRLMFDLGFDPKDDLTRYLTSKTPKGLGDAVSAKDASNESVREWANANIVDVKDRERASLPALPAAPTRENTSASGTSATPAESGKGAVLSDQQNQTLPRNATTTLDALAKLVENLESFGPLQPKSAARLGELIERLGNIPTTA